MRIHYVSAIHTPTNSRVHLELTTRQVCGYGWEGAAVNGCFDPGTGEITVADVSLDDVDCDSLKNE